MKKRLKRNSIQYKQLYTCWNNMKGRCYNENCPKFADYGGRGIKICNEWKDDFMAFQKWSIENGFKPNMPRGKMSIDRIDNNKGYSPENCRWVAYTVQANNTRVQTGNKKYQKTREERKASTAAKREEMKQLHDFNMFVKYGMKLVNGTEVHNCKTTREAAKIAGVTHVAIIKAVREHRPCNGWTITRVVDDTMIEITSKDGVDYGTDVQIVAQHFNVSPKDIYACLDCKKTIDGCTMRYVDSCTLKEVK